jgi:hypothetical protein
VTTCDECGFDWDGGPDQLISALASLPRRFVAPVTRFLPGEDGDAVVRTRPEPSVWSALEYVAHVRDALLFYEQRIRRVLAEDRPHLAAYGFDAACEARHYNHEIPADAAEAVGQAATSLADLLGSLREDAWGRVGIGSEGDERTVLVLARRAAHEGHHHLLDVGRGLRHVREQLRGH